VAYLVGRYPAISHTFIARELASLRRRGAVVSTISIHQATPEHLLSVADREAFDSTYYLTPPRIRDHLLAHARAISSRGTRYVSTLLWALRAGDPGARAKLRQLSYFAEAVVCWWRCNGDSVSHVHGQFCGPASDAAMLAAMLGGRRWTWSFAAHGTDILQVSRRRLATKVERATFVICASDFGRTLLMSLVAPSEWEKLEVVRCGVDVAQYQPVPSSANRPDQPVELLSVGRLEREKGHRLLLDAVAHPLLSDVALRLTLIGDGSERRPLEEHAASLGIADRVRFLGRVGQDRITANYATADIFCLPSLGEGVPVVLMEAMAMEVPVVAPRLMGIPELVNDGVEGVLFAPGRANEIACAIRELVDSAELRERLGVAGRARIEREFEVDGCAAQLAQVFERRAPSGQPA
jgi:glycosyltransferase involved in cell wall biosynthesis